MEIGCNYIESVSPVDVVCAFDVKVVEDIKQNDEKDPNSSTIFVRAEKNCAPGGRDPYTNILKTRPDTHEDIDSFANSMVERAKEEGVTIQNIPSED